MAFLLNLSPLFAAETLQKWEMAGCKDLQCVRIYSPKVSRGEIGPVFYLKGEIQIELHKNIAEKGRQVLKGTSGYYEPEIGIVTIELSDGKMSFIYLVKEGRWGFLPNS